MDNTLYMYVVCCIILVVHGISGVNAVRGTDEQNQESRRLSKSKAEYYKYSLGRGGASKRQEIPLDPSPSPSDSPTPYPYSYDEVSVSYTTVTSPDWPSDSQWQNELASRLSSGAKLINNMFKFPINSYDQLCPANGSVQSWQKGGNGVCMYHEFCEFRFCNRDGQRVLDLPAYSVEVRTPDDISAAMEFAERYNIQVSVKTTGHSFSGSSIMGNSLNIWMANYPTDGTVKTVFQDSCGTQHGPAIGINGGERFDDVFEAIKRDYHILSGDTRSVSAAGGWLQGVGLSHTSRMYGLGIDNVLQFNVVLPSGEQAVADACSNPDLFWALRGGGGGTFGVVTHVEYKLHPKTKLTFIYLWVDWKNKPRALELFLQFWAANTPSFDRRVGGAWFGPNYAEVFVVGDENVADASLFTKAFGSWLKNVLKPAGFKGNFWVDEYDSWYDYHGGEQGYNQFLEEPREFFQPSTRLVPEAMVRNDPNNLVNFLVDLAVETDWWGAYWLGGAVNDVGADTTAVHPAMRRSIWAITTSTRAGAQRVRNFLPNDISGCSFNHQGPGEPEWRTSLWGDDHYARLLSIKNRYDPKRRLNCWHCVGYQGPDYNGL